MFSQLPCFGENSIRLTSFRARLERLVESPRRVGVEVYQGDFLAVRVATLQQGGDFLGPVHFRPALASRRLAPGGQGLAEHEDRCGARPLVLVVDALRMISGGGNRYPGFLAAQVVRPTTGCSGSYGFS